jgi:hypothetical protein
MIFAYSLQIVKETLINTKSLSNGFEFEAAWCGGRISAARKFLKNQGSPVFQKLWRKAFNLILNATWYNRAKSPLILP